MIRRGLVGLLFNFLGRVLFNVQGGDVTGNGNNTKGNKVLVTLHLSVVGHGKNGKGTIGKSRLVGSLARLLFLGSGTSFKLRFIFNGKTVGGTRVLQGQIIRSCTTSYYSGGNTLYTTIFFF